jgi:hypothetical protein
MKNAILMPHGADLLSRLEHRKMLRTEWNQRRALRPQKSNRTAVDGGRACAADIRRLRTKPRISGANKFAPPSVLRLRNEQRSRRGKIVRRIDVAQLGQIGDAEFLRQSRERV